MDNIVGQNIETLALSLKQTYFPAPWLSEVKTGLKDGIPCLIVYLCGKMPQTTKRVFPKNWHGVPIEVKDA